MTVEDECDKMNELPDDGWGIKWGTKEPAELMKTITPTQRRYIQKKGFIIHSPGDGTEIPSYPYLDLGGYDETYAPHFGIEYHTCGNSGVSSGGQPHPRREGCTDAILINCIEDIVSSDRMMEEFNNTDPIHVLERDQDWRPIIDLLSRKYPVKPAD